MIRWFVENWLIEGSANIIGGAPAAGKTGLEIGLMAAALEGREWLGQQTFKPKRWIQFVTDRDLSNREYWAKAHGITLPGPEDTYCYRKHKEDRIGYYGTAAQMMGRALDLLHRRLDDLRPMPGTVLTIDVASPFLPAGGANYLDTSEKGHGLMDVLECFPGMTALLLAHSGKYNKHTSSGRATDRVIGGTAVFGLLQTMLYICTRAETQDVEKYKKLDGQVLYVMPRMGIEAEIALGRDANGCLLEYPLGDTSAQARATGRPQKLTMEQLLDYFREPANSTMVINAVARDLNLHQSTVQKRFAEARDQALIHEAERGKWVRAS